MEWLNRTHNVQRRSEQITAFFKKLVLLAHRHVFHPRKAAFAMQYSASMDDRRRWVGDVQCPSTGGPGPLQLWENRTMTILKKTQNKGRKPHRTIETGRISASF